MQEHEEPEEKEKLTSSKKRKKIKDKYHLKKGKKFKYILGDEIYKSSPKI